MVRSEHITDDDDITLANLEHAAHCAKCHKELEIEELRGRGVVAEIVSDLVREFQNGWSLNAPDILQQPSDNPSTEH